MALVRIPSPARVSQPPVRHVGRRRRSQLGLGLRQLHPLRPQPSHGCVPAAATASSPLRSGSSPAPHLCTSSISSCQVTSFSVLTCRGSFPVCRPCHDACTVPGLLMCMMDGGEEPQDLCGEESPCLVHQVFDKKLKPEFVVILVDFGSGTLMIEMRRPGAELIPSGAKDGLLREAMSADQSPDERAK